MAAAPDRCQAVQCVATASRPLIESRDAGIDDGVARLERSLTRPAATLDVLCDAVLGAVFPHWPGDDVALLVSRPRAFDATWVAVWDVAADPAAEARKNAVGQLETWTSPRALHHAHQSLSIYDPGAADLTIESTSCTLVLALLGYIVQNGMKSGWREFICGRVQALLISVLRSLPSAS